MWISGLQLKRLKFTSILLLSFLVTSCGTDNSSSQGASQGNTYKETKSMVLDILKSDDGKKAISDANRSIMNGDVGTNSIAGQSQIKLLSANESLQLQMAVKDVLTAEENNKFLQDMMKDPKFAGDFAKAIQKDTKQMFKELLKDPEYQKSLVDVMKNPDYEKMVLDTMKTAAYRQQMMTVMQESLQSPLFKAQMVDLLKAAIEQQSKPSELSQQSTQQAQKSDQGGGGGGDQQQQQSGGEKKEGDGGQKEGEDSQKESDSGDKKKKESSNDDSSNNAARKGLWGDAPSPFLI
ncbi:spore germination lipoprotein GerD [Paenibacillus hexagrammi]|uniref:Spore gernimation protein n=1 Tax=Paenibacillus hexagrammi TaxID=2908839 RepID=A0ABY3SID6_9BACL|nr:spore germination lipoprotein GerD [Paenibacillus sp. YPD9-1]UJF33716.1 spore gernimation protein [Paenibacillus sp. YPD9-1]